MYYARTNPMGFANTNDVLAFETRRDRDAFVDENPAVAIKRNEVTQNRSIEPRPFSGEYWGIVDDMLVDAPSGYVGNVRVVDATVFKKKDGKDFDFVDYVPLAWVELIDGPVLVHA